MHYPIHLPVRLVLALGCIAGVSGAGAASDKLEIGKVEYEASCSNCHGMSAKGDGKMAASLASPPADLTTLAARNNGVFPTQRVWQVIDGRSARSSDAHGSREMPVWGNVYLTDDGQPHELNVRTRIEALVAYLQGLQAR